MNPPAPEGHTPGPWPPPPGLLGVTRSQDSESVGLGWSQRFCISDQLTGDANATGPQITVAVDAAPLKIKAYFNDTADLPCLFTNSQNLSMSELVVFWQNQEASVLYELYLGKEKPDNVNRKYMGRTSFDWENWTLRLHNIQIKDQGSYQCFIHHKKPKGMVLIYQMNSDLSVLANFSQPEIIEISNITENLCRNLTCSSIQGYPEPKKMSFWLKTENSTTVYDGVMQKSQDNVTELYNVSISLSVSLPAVTSNMTIICVLQTEPMKTELFSSPFYIDPKVPPFQPPDYTVWIATAIPLTLAIGIPLILRYISCRRKKQQQPGVSNERGESVFVLPADCHFVATSQSAAF
ncbi:T-lymphocyte activation antigen CD86 [Eulemur rufifrons]|uniref:T-lymphocyte activation antigen CD86 n=1 Tax=Eulemur rufifrons TaxID=859984 RepID=UPI003742D36C